MTPRAAGLILSAALLQAACLVEVTHVDDPSAAFRAARAEAQRHDGRPGPARQINVLVWDPSDRELVRVRVPMWLARKVEGHVDWDDVQLDGRDDKLKRVLERHARLDDIARAGLGTLVEVDEEGGEQVLIWLK